MEMLESDIQDCVYADNWIHNHARVRVKDGNIEFIHLKCEQPLDVSINLTTMIGKYDEFLHFQTKCRFCPGHKQRFMPWRKSYIDNKIKMRRLHSDERMFVDQHGDHLEGVHGIEKKNNDIFLLDKHGGCFGRMRVHAKTASLALARIQNRSLWNIVRRAIHCRNILFYWYEQSQRNKLSQMIAEDYAAMDL